MDGYKKRREKGVKDVDSKHGVLVGNSLYAFASRALGMTVLSRCLLGRLPTAVLHFVEWLCSWPVSPVQRD